MHTIGSTQPEPQEPLTEQQREVQNLAPNVRLPPELLDRIVDGRRSVDRYQNLILRAGHNIVGNAALTDNEINSSRRVAQNAIAEHKNLDRARRWVSRHVINESNR